MSARKSRIPILITGCQRSGTTLSSLILDSHPDIWNIDEYQFSLPAIYHYLFGPVTRPASFVSFKLPEYAHVLPFIEALPGCRLLWCIRNPLDVVWSMIKLNITFGGITAPWAAHPRGGLTEITHSYPALTDEQKAALSDHMTEFARLTEGLKNLLSSPERSAKVNRWDCVFIGAFCWRIKNELPMQYKARNIGFHVVRYEDLVTNPKDRIAQLLDYIGAEWCDEVLMHHRLHKGMSIGSTSNTRAIDQNSLGEGGKNLSQEEQNLIKTICGSVATRWNYFSDNKNS